VIDDLIVYRIQTDEYLIVANAGNRHAVLVQLLNAAEHFEVEVTDESEQWVLLALQGPKATSVLNEFVDIDLEPLPYYSIASGKIGQTEVLLARTGYTGEDGFEIFIPDNEALKIFRALAVREEVRVCGLAARDTLRLEAGMPLYGHELTLDVNPFEAGLGRVVALDKDDFVGKVALEELKTQKKWKLYGLKGEGKRAARAEYEIYLPGGENPIGQVTSGALSPTLGYPVALAYLDGSLELEIGSKLEADVRGTRIGYEVVELPFYRR
jgi:aminomethyltransferase